MRYKEIITESSSLSEIARPKTRVQADAVLRDAGYTRLGKGHFGAVYQKSGKPYVLKVFTAKDYAYKNFINLVKAFPNEHFPKFIGKIINVTPDICAIRMEPLSEFKVDPSRKYLLYMINDYLAYGKDESEYMEYHPKMKQACDLIRLHLSDFSIDVSQNNVMMRGKTLIFVDPVVDYSAFHDDDEKLPAIEPVPRTALP
jgi:hypothetical protein